MPTRLASSLAALALLAALPAAAPAAEPGDIDISFGPGGMAYALPSPQPATSYGLTVTPGGAVVAAGVQERPRLDPQAPPELAGALVRWNRDGVVDPSFGLLGSAAAPGGAHISSGPVPRPGGGFVAAATAYGERSTEFATVAFGASGAAEPTFGTGGIATSGEGSATEAVVQPDGKVVTVGSAANGIDLIRHDARGRLDPSFGGDGRVHTPIVQQGGIGKASAVERQPDGKLVVSAWIVDESSAMIADPANMKVGWVVARYLPDGSLDPGFGDGGIVRDMSPSALNVTNGDVAIQRDGRILVAGSFGKPRPDGPPQLGDTAASVIRYRPDGKRDTSFGRGGLAQILEVRSGRAVAVQPDGKVVLGAYYERWVNKRWDEAFALGRFHANGRPDDSFGDGGLVLTRGASGGAGRVQLTGIVDVDLQGDRLLATGPVRECGHGVFAVVAYHAERSSLPATDGPLMRVCTPRPEAQPDGDLPIDLGCPALEPVCNGDVTVELPGEGGVRVPVAKARFSAKGGRAKTALPKLPARVRSTLEKRGKLKATVLLRARNKRGKHAAVRRRIVMRAAR